jgi:hypothetical protein
MDERHSHCDRRGTAAAEARHVHFDVGSRYRMNVHLILTAVAIIFLILATVRIARNAARVDPAARTWLLIAVIFGAVSVWLWIGEKSR